MTAAHLARPYRPAIEAFERGEIDPDRFDHPAHVYVAWSYLLKMPLPQAALAFCSALRRLTRSLGAETKYHETISWFFMILIAERRNGRAALDWAAFESANPDLLHDPGEQLAACYSPARLALPLARRQFLLPDRGPAPA